MSVHVCLLWDSVMILYTVCSRFNIPANLVSCEFVECEFVLLNDITLSTACDIGSLAWMYFCVLCVWCTFCNCTDCFDSYMELRL